MVEKNKEENMVEIKNLNKEDMLLIIKNLNEKGDNALAEKIERQLSSQQVSKKQETFNEYWANRQNVPSGNMCL